jgi:hypothetical protein
MQIAQKTFAGAGTEGMKAHQGRLAEWRGRKERLEVDLAAQIPEMNVEQKLRTADCQTVALALPEAAALVEFVRFHVLDFRAIRSRRELEWKPPRYVAFVLRAGAPDDVNMIDLGEGEAIDEMIGAFRRAITGEAEGHGGQDFHGRPVPLPKSRQGVALCATVFDPLLDALGNRKRLLVAPDGDLTRLPFEVLPTSSGSRLIDEYRITYLGTGRDVLRFGAPKSGRSTNPLVVADPDF